MGKSNDRMMVSIVSMGKYKGAFNEALALRDDKGSFEIRLVPERDNKFDKDAVKAFLITKKEDLEIGYVASNPDFIQEDYFGVKDEEFKEWMKGKNEEIVEYYGDNIISMLGKNNNPINIIGMRSLEVPEVKEKELQVIGSLTIYPDRKAVIDKMNSLSNKIELTIKKEDTGRLPYNVYSEGKLIGKLKGERDLTPFGEEFTLETTRHENGTIFGEPVPMKGKVFTPDEDIELEVDEIAKKRIVGKRELRKRIDYMRSNNVSNLVIMRILKSYINYPKAVKDKIPNPKTLYIDDDGLVNKSLSYLVLNKNLKYEGEKGTGKNVLTETIAWLTNRPLYEFPMNSQHSNASLFGSLTFAEGSSKSLVFQKSTLTEAFETGGILVLDEFNTALPHVVSMLNGMLDQRRRQYVPDYGMVEGHENFIAIATENKNYTGTFATNEATSDRFVPIVFPNLKSIVDIILKHAPDINSKDLEICSDLFLALKNGVEIGTIEETALTVRGFISAAEALEIGLPLKETLIDNIANRASDLDDRESIKAMIEMMIA